MQSIQIGDIIYPLEASLLQRLSKTTPSGWDISSFLWHLFQNLCAEILKAKHLPNHGEHPDLYRETEGELSFFEVKLSQKGNGNMIKRGQLKSHLEQYPNCNYVLGYYNQEDPAKIYQDCLSLKMSVRKRIKIFLPHSLYVIPATRIQEWYDTSEIQEKPKRGVSRDFSKPLRENEVKRSLIPFDIAQEIIRM